MWMLCTSLVCTLLVFMDTTAGQTTPPRECPDDKFGANCTSSCGRCRNDLPCDVINGECQDGCSDGWMGRRCLEGCPGGQFGPNCSFSCGHCRNDVPCDVSTGECRNGCADGWRGRRCFYECEGGSYGENCTFRCGICRNGQPCDVVTGECREGCSDGWQGRLCLQVCRDGRYGRDCVQRCGFCQGRCHPVSGECQHGCAEGWLGKYCLQHVPLPEIKDILIRTLTIVSIVVGVIMVFSIGMCVYHCWLADRTRPGSGQSESDSSSVHSGHTVSASAVMLRNLAHRSRTLSQLYSVFSWGSDFEDREARKDQAAKPEAGGVLYANGQIAMGGSPARLSQEVPPPTLCNRDPLYQNSEPVQGGYENWTS